MTQFDQFKQQIKTLYALVKLQKSARLALRTLWMGMVGVLLGWALDALWGWLPNPFSWIALGLAFALFPIAGVVIHLFPILGDFAPPRPWINSLDSHLRQRHQLSTAWEVAQQKDAGLVSDLLVHDMLALIPGARSQVLAGGWFRKLDLAATALVMLLACGLLAALLLRSAPPPATANPAPAIPQAVPQPEDAPGTGDEQQPNAPGSESGAPQGGQGQEDQAGQDGSGAEDGSGAQGAESGSTPGGDSSDAAAGGNPEAVADALRRMGEQLSEQAGTYDLGQALENLDMNGAAEALEDFSGELEDVSPETRENLSDALEDTARDLEDANTPSLPEDMRDAADALQGEDESSGDALGKVADDLRQLDGALRAAESGGDGAGQERNGGNAGRAEPAERINNETGQMEIPQEETNNSDLLSPSQSDTPGADTAAGSLDSIRPQRSSGGQSPLLPSSLLWKWRDVVSQYFQR